MARTAEDIALMLSAIAGPDPRAPIAISEPGQVFSQSLERDFKGVKIAWCHELGGIPIDSQVAEVIDGQRHIFESLSCVVVDDEPDFTDADEIFKVLRAWHFELAYADLLATYPDGLKDTVIWNVKEGAKLSGSQIGRAEIQRTELYHRVREFMRQIEFLILPVSQVPPFDVKQRYVTEINDVKMDTYIDWMKTCYYVTVTGLPAISVPCGFTSDGLPVGVQIVGRHQDDFGVLQLAHAFEKATGFARRRPPVVE
jgi:amidase